MADKVTTILMVVKVDLECPSCDKKIKKILAKFPEIRDQVYDVKKGTITITVVCCNPEKIRGKLCCKGGKTIRGIEIKVPSNQEPPNPPEEKKKPPNPPEEKKKPPNPPEQKKKSPNPPEEKKKPPCQKEAPSLVLVPVPRYPPCYPMGVCCGPGYGGGPCNCGHGLPVPCYDNYGYTRRWYYSRCDYFSEESLYACTIL